MAQNLSHNHLFDESRLKNVMNTNSSGQLGSLPHKFDDLLVNLTSHD